jgi:hypothetical protein
MIDQLELLPLAPFSSSDPQRNSRTPQQEAAFQAVLTRCRKECSELNAIGHQMYTDFVDMLNCPIERYKAICLYWHESKGHKLAEVVERVRPSIRQKPIKQWSIEAKRRKRLKALHERTGRKYSFPELFHQAIQEQLLTNPDYYGVCPLPSENACKYFPPNLRHIAAIEKENYLRKLSLRPTAIAIKDPTTEHQGN